MQQCLLCLPIPEHLHGLRDTREVSRLYTVKLRAFMVVKISVINVNK